MAGKQSSSKRKRKDTAKGPRSWAAAQRRHKARDKRQRELAHANMLIRGLTDAQVREIRSRHEGGEAFSKIAASFGMDEFTIARADRYGRLAPWQHARGVRDAARKPLQDAYAKRKKGNQLPATAN
jgi:hypothetical protein